MRRIVLLFLVLLLAVLAAAPTSADDRVRRRPAVAEQVDLARYMGLWYEIARIPTRFQKSCICCATAEYVDEGKGKVSILNRCVQADGSVKEAKAEARVISANNARWKATFFKLLGIPVAKGDYWILGVDDDYRWAVVGDPERKYGWILSRSPDMAPEVRAEVDALIADRGYDPGMFIDTPQDGGHHE